MNAVRQLRKSRVKRRLHARNGPAIFSVVRVKYARGMQPDAGFGVGLQFGYSVPSLRISKSARRRGYTGAITTANASRASQTLPMHRKLCHDRLCGTPGLSPTAAASAPRGKMTLQFLFKALASLLRDLFFLIRSVSWAGAKTWIRSKSISKSCRESAQEVSKLESGRKTRPEAFTQFPSRHFPFPASSFKHRLAERRMRQDLARHALRPGFCFGFLPKKNRARQTPFRPICRALQKFPSPRARRRRRPSAVSRGGLSSRGREARIRRVFPRRRSPSRPYWCACPCRGACCSL